MKLKMKLKIYGSKGSTPYLCESTMKYGGNTSCYRLDVAGRTVILDAGTGLQIFDRDLREARSTGAYSPIKFDMLISHLHLDHISGLVFFTPFYDPRNEITIHTRSRGTEPLKKQVLGLYKPPYWPVDVSELARAVTAREIHEDTPFKIGKSIRVLPFAACHPNDTTSFVITAEGKKLVYMLDSEITDVPHEKLLPYTKDADCIIFDAAYLPKDYPDKLGFGHSTFQQGITLSKVSNCKKLILTHFSFDYSDELIDGVAELLKDEHADIVIARDGMELTI